MATKAARPATTPAPAAAPVAPVAETGTWLLQADAAARTGFSVSAIRKWRRAGLVADRMRTTAGGSERVEVRLEDVEARRAEQPPERTQTTPSPPEAGPSPGTAIIPLNDLEALFGRVREAEGRCRDAEARQQAAEVETRYLSGQLAELRQQLQAATAEAVAARAAVEDRRSRVTVMTAARVAAPTTGGGPGPTDSPRNAFDRATLDRVTADLLGLDPNRERRPATPPPAPTTTRTSRPTPIRPTERPAAGPAPAATPGRRPTAPAAPASRTGPAAERAVPRPPPPGSGRQGQDRVTAGPPGRESAPGPNGASRDVTVESLASELRRLYGRLDGYRREPTISRARERQREQDLADYDAVLLQACAALAVPTGLRSGEKVSIERRAALTRSLARLGIDVRADPAPATRRR
ncbi:MAG: hypothetical protein QOG82_299 [Actinomycetota bacterium]|nr:hypothetical protein [Actinomycetota bacterium]